MKPGLQLRTAPTLTLSPQLQQAIRLLQLSSLELQQKLQQMLAENPFLEQVEDSASLSQTGEDPGQETTFAAKTDTENNASTPDTFSVLSDEPGSFAAVHEHDDNWREEADASVLDNGEQSGLPEGTPAHALEEMWGGEGSTTPTDATETANAGFQHVTLHDHLRQQALALRLDEAGRAALDGHRPHLFPVHHQLAADKAPFARVTPPAVLIADRPAEHRVLIVQQVIGGAIGFARRRIAVDRRDDLMDLVLRGAEHLAEHVDRPQVRLAPGNGKAGPFDHAVIGQHRAPQVLVAPVRAYGVKLGAAPQGGMFCPAH